MIRPHPARWFELLVARDDTTQALEALAATGAVELESRADAGLPSGFAGLPPLLQQFAEFGLRYRAYWPRDGLHPSPFTESPQVTLQRCIACVRAWAMEAEPLIRQSQSGQAERAQWLHWQRVVQQLPDGLIDLAQAAAAGPLLRMRLYVFPAAGEPELEGGALVRSFLDHGNCYALAVGTAAQQQALEQQARLLKGQSCEVPPCLGRDQAGNEAAIADQLAALDERERQAQASLAALARAHGLRQALADAQRLQWVLENVCALESGALFCRVTGWSCAPDYATLEQAVERSGARALLRFAPPPAGARAPLLLVNPWWARPFEIFSRAMGMPSANEADASVLLALAVPLMFGYMFGDVGQGLVIAAAGFALRRRWPLARLFVAGGLSATAFGLLFGSVFSLHAIHAWWIEPLEDPLAVLAVPLAGGAALLTIGLLLAAVEAHWRGELGRWLSTDAGLVLCYLGLVTTFFQPRGLVVAAAGAALFCAGHAWREKRLSASLAALAELVERLLQVLINTLSFARVGAFALAHAGLSSAIVALMGATSHPVVAALVLVLGNIVVVLLEGLVVSIQTTRLVLFEFFTRFLEAQGRVFRPLPPPPSTFQET